MWVDNDSTGDPQNFLAPTSGLFPAPLPVLAGGEETGSDGGGGTGSSTCAGGGAKGKALAQQRRSVIGRFRFLGRLAARCLMDGQVRASMQQYSSSAVRRVVDGVVVFVAVVVVADVRGGSPLVWTRSEDARSK